MDSKRWRGKSARTTVFGKSGRKTCL
ncbi:protein of unknown function (plasmid) [Azospirillum baldaniorum]|uniref:Uncharacterized protein n=1 Tax=Azospirillum baldaniorum TaxID=1064539 RepID=A0A9P1JUQ8_9PROT|nr:protein of unknown function [Azospirillum baldaniorum]